MATAQAILAQDCYGSHTFTYPHTRSYLFLAMGKALLAVVRANVTVYVNDWALAQMFLKDLVGMET
eukprot:9982238-Prorocentrum_lima.AAC.1